MALLNDVSRCCGERWNAGNVKVLIVCPHRNQCARHVEPITGPRTPVEQWVCETDSYAMRIPLAD